MSDHIWRRAAAVAARSAPRAHDGDRPATFALNAPFPWDRALVAAVFLAFIVHAFNYLYFFVDDEAIPFIFAKHLLAGKGLVYNTLEGPVEGYSDFLHVLLAALYLSTARLFNSSPLTVFFLGKAVSFASGLTTLAVLWSALRKHDAVRQPGATAGLVFLATATPLAAWSCSSLEMAPTVLLVAILTAGLCDTRRPSDRLIAMAACLLVLIRIDGFVYVGALVTPAWLMASPNRRRTLLLRVVVPVVATLAVYHAWRIWYFGDWLSAPITTKTLYKIRDTPNIVARQPVANYLPAFLTNYGFGMAIVAAALVTGAVWRRRAAWPLLASAALLFAYAAIVGDWMFGFRFVLPALPVTAVLIAMAISTIRRRRLAVAATVVACCWFSVAAVRGAGAYASLEYRESWWRSPSFDARRYFGPYLRVYEAVRPLVRSGGLVAYNQAGLVPYLLDVDNIDDLGVCSRFVARLPTSDVVFTEAGRYSPLTNAFALRAANAYLLYRAPDLLIAPLGNLRAANHGELPAQLLRSHYTKLFAVPHAPAVVYARSPERLDEFRSSPRVFLENLAHPSHVRAAWNDGEIPSEQYLARLPFLADSVLDRMFVDRLRYDVTFAAHNERIHEIDIEQIWSRTAADVRLTLAATDGAIVREEIRHLTPDHSEHVRLQWPAGIDAARLILVIENREPMAARVRLRDVRVQGQPPALARYVQQLPFSAPAQAH